MKNIYYLYEFITHQLLYITEDEAKLEEVHNWYENNGIMTYIVDNYAMVNNIKVEMKNWKEAQK